MANAILTTTIAPAQAPDGMPRQALVAILVNGVYQLSYRRTFDGLAPSLASAIVPGAALQFSGEGQPVLLDTGTVNLNTATVQPLYTVPVGFIFIPYRIVIRNASVSLTTVSLSIGFNAVAYDDVVANAVYTELTGPTLETNVFPKVGAAIGNAADVLTLKNNTLQGAAATAIVAVFGYLIGV